MDRLIALVLLRWRVELRGLRRTPERLAAMLLAVPGLVLLSTLGAFFLYAGLRSLDASRPELMLTVASVAATGVGVFWLLSPLLTGLTLSQTQDLSRLMHFPIPLPTLVAAALAANVTQPMVVAKLPLLAAATVALAERAVLLPLAAIGVFLAFAFMLAVDQVVHLLLHGLSRSRRAHDLALFAGIGLTFLVSLAPLVFFTGAGRRMAALFGRLLASDAFVLSPFAWGARAAVHGGRGELLPFALFALAALLAVAATLAASAALVGRIHRGELDLGPGPAATATGRGRIRLPGAIGGLVEKDLKLAWRDPALKAALFMGLAGPLLFLFVLTRTQPGGGGGLLVLATLVGGSAFGGNAFGLERRGLALLMSFPVERWRILVAKNAAGFVLRLPAWTLLLAGGALLAPLHLLPALATAALVTFLISSAADNFMSILFPAPVAAPGRMSGAGPTGRSGLAGAFLAAVMLLASLAVASPFLFLVWLPVLLETPVLWLAALPMALAGAGAVYAMLVAAAARLLLRREPELLERVLPEPEAA